VSQILTECGCNNRSVVCPTSPLGGKLVNSTAGGCTHRTCGCICYLSYNLRKSWKMSGQPTVLAWNHLNWPLVTSDSPWATQEPAVLPTQVPVPANCESRITVFWHGCKEWNTQMLVTPPATNVPVTMRSHLDLRTCSFWTSSHSDREPICYILTKIPPKKHDWIGKTETQRYEGAI